MTSVVYNTVIDQGADWFITFYWKNPDGTPVIMNDYTAAMQLRSFPQDTISVLTLTTDEGITITPEEGRIDVHATHEQTTAIDEGFYFYDLEVTDNNYGVVTRLSQGQINVTAQVTRT